MKDGIYIVTFDEYKSVGAHWIALYVNDNSVNFDSLGAKPISKEIKKFIDNKNITNIFQTNAYDLICTFFCIGFIDFMFKGKRLTDTTNLFSLNNFRKNDKVILTSFLK